MELAGPCPELESGEGQLRPDPFLSDFMRLGELIFLYKPSPAPSLAPDTSRSNIPDPDLIIVCSWMYAASKHISKYIKYHQKTYPTSPILLLRQDGGDFFVRTKAEQLRNIEPAVATIRDLSVAKAAVGFSTGSSLTVLMHVFSNGGAWTACSLADAYTKTTSCRLPITTLILDSTPSLPNLQAAHKAICEIIPKTASPAVRTLGSAFVWGYIRVARAVDSVLGIEDPTLRLRRRFNDPEGPFMAEGVKVRVYIYSQGDQLIPAADVESHMSEASLLLDGSETKTRQNRVRAEDFGPNSRHVGHMMSDTKRYWDVVETAWRDSVVDAT